MTRSLQITGNDSPPQDMSDQIGARPNTNAAMSHVKATGENANQVQVDHVAPPPATMAPAGGSVMTTQGLASIRTPFGSKDAVVTLPDGMEVEYAAAVQQGLIDPNATIGDKAPEGDKAPKDAPKDAPKADDGETGLLATDDGGAVLAEHSTGMAQIESALTGAGLDAESAFAEVIGAMVTSEDGSFEGDIATALNDKLGVDAVQAIADQGEQFFAHAVATALMSEGLANAGLTEDDMTSFYQTKLVAQPAIVVAALRGNLGPVKAALSQHFAGRRK